MVLAWRASGDARVGGSAETQRRCFANGFASAWTRSDSSADKHVRKMDHLRDCLRLFDQRKLLASRWVSEGGRSVGSKLRTMVSGAHERAADAADGSCGGRF